MGHADRIDRLTRLGSDGDHTVGVGQCVGAGPVDHHLAVFDRERNVGGIANDAPCTQVVIVRQIRWADAVRLAIDLEDQFFFHSGAVDPAFVQRLDFKRHLVDRTTEAESQRFILILVTQPIAVQSSGCVAGPGRGRHRARAAADRDHGAVGQRLGGVGSREGLGRTLRHQQGCRHGCAQATDQHWRIVAALYRDVQSGTAGEGGVGEHITQRVRRALQRLHTGFGVVQHIAVGAVGVQRQGTISACECTAHRADHVGAGLDAGDRQVRADVVAQHTAGHIDDGQCTVAGGVVGVGNATAGFKHSGRVVSGRSHIAKCRHHLVVGVFCTRQGVVVGIEVAGHVAECACAHTNGGCTAGTLCGREQCGVSRTRTRKVGERATREDHVAQGEIG